MTDHALRSPRPASRWVLMLLLWAGCSGGALAEPDPLRPQVLVGFEVEADKFRQNLPQLPQASAEMAKAIAAEFALRYPFADWAGGPVAAGNPPIGRLVARLVQQPAIPLPEISVKWFGTAGDGAPVALALPAIEIYSPGVIDRETNNRQALVSHVLQRVLPVVRSDGFQQRFMEAVVQGLPIANAAEMHPTDHVVVIPRLWRDLRLGQETKLLLVFKKPVVGGPEQQGMVKLVLPSPRTRSPKQGWLEAAVQDASIGASPLTLDKGWHASFPALLEGAKVACYIRDYRPAAFSGVLDGVSLVSD